MNKRRKDTIAEYEAHGAHWCAEKLYAAREERDAMRERAKRKAEELMRANGKAGVYNAVLKANYNLARVLTESGIRPTLLRVYYSEYHCDKCGVEDCDRYIAEECDDFDDVVETISFYTYRIKDDVLDGIDSEFKSRLMECKKIVDDRTGEVLYEAKEEE